MQLANIRLLEWFPIEQRNLPSYTGYLVDDVANRMGESSEDFGGGEADPHWDPRKEHPLPRRRVPPRRRGVGRGPGFAGDDCLWGVATMKYRNWKKFSNLKSISGIAHYRARVRARERNRNEENIRRDKRNCFISQK